MRVSRFFVPHPLSPNSTVEIIDERAHYIRNVLRLKAQDSLVLFDGTGGEYQAILLEVAKKAVTAQTSSFNPINRTPARSLTMGLGILKRDAMDFALQKAVELGVSHVQPLITDRVTVSLKQIKTRQTHWQSIAISSCEQCGLNLMPQIFEPRPLSEWCKNIAGSLFIADPSAELRQLQFNTTNSRVSVLIGPEGGLTETEVALAKKHGFQGTNLGERILRAETAAISLLTLVNQPINH